MKIQRTTRSVEEIPLSSTADIAFLLIVFFLAASALLEMRGVRLPVPKKDAPPMEILKKNIYQIDVDAKGRLSHNGAPKELGLLLDESGRAFAQNPRLVVLIKVSSEAPIYVIPKIVQGLQELEIPRISVSMAK